MCKTNSEYIQAWETRLNLQGLDEDSIRGYKAVVNGLSTFTDKLFTEVSSDDIESLVVTKNSPATKERYQVVIIAFYNWMVNTGKMEKHPFPHMIKVQKPKRLPKSLNYMDYIAVQQYVKKEFNKKYQLIFSLIVSTGLRVHEVVKIKVKDFDFDRGTLNVIGKEDKERLVSIDNETLIQRIKEYLKANDITDKNAYIFPSKTIEGEHLSTKCVNDQFKKAEKELGLSSFHPHTLRHQFAVDYLSNGGDVTCLQQILGHENLSTTQIYTEKYKEQVMADAKKHAKFNVI
jgi:integrase/recombinase XerD